MKILKIFIILFLSIGSSQLKSDEINNELKSKILKNIRCLICQGQSVYDSESEFALSIKLIVSKKLNEGRSEKQIYQFLKEKYGEWILYDPQLNKKTYILWLLPILLFKGFTKTLHKSKYVEYIKSKKFIIKTNYKQVHIDGEPINGEKENIIEVLPLSLNILV